jgi:hypothetical protein
VQDKRSRFSCLKKSIRDKLLRINRNVPMHVGIGEDSSSVRNTAVAELSRRRISKCQIDSNRFKGMTRKNKSSRPEVFFLCEWVRLLSCWFLLDLGLTRRSEKARMSVCRKSMHFTCFHPLLSEEKFDREMKCLCRSE